MAHSVNNSIRTYKAGEDLPVNVLVKLSAGNTVVKNTAGAAAIGITLEKVSSGGYVALRLLSSPGSAIITASAAIALNALVYGTASGKIDDTGTGEPIGYAAEAATADGDQIEVLLRGVSPLAMEASADQAAVVAASTDGTAAAAVDLAALKAESEKIGDDVRAVITLANALRTALVNKGLIKGAA